MNLNYWLPWRDFPPESKDSTYEEEVIERCDHDFERTSELLPNPQFSEAVIEDGYLVVPQYELVEEFCTKCGEPGLEGEAYPYCSHDYTFACPYDGEWRQVARKLAFDADIVLGPDCSVADAKAEPVKSSGDDLVRYVNKSEQDESDAPLVPDLKYGSTD